VPRHPYNRHHKLLLAVDCIIFGFDGGELKALLIKRGFEPEKGKWSLMGGFVGKDESADEAASRVLAELTGMENVYMEQLHTFSDIDRDSAGRVASVAYFSLIRINGYDKNDQQRHEAKWFSMHRLPRLIFDHAQMIKKAKAMLQAKVVSQPIGFELLPSKFTLPQLQSLYEAILERKLDKRNFLKKISSLGIVQRLDEKDKSVSRKGAFYYKFNRKRYRQLESKGGFKI
jgi:8-oxo-dGTP diphosphatase